MRSLKNQRTKKLSAVHRISLSYGVSYKGASYFCYLIGINPNSSETNLNNDHKKKVSKFRISKQKQPSEALRFKKDRIRLKKKIRCYQGIRHLQSLPVNGQNTKNNAKIAKKKNN